MNRSKNTALNTCQLLSSAENLPTLQARVVEWQTRTFEGRMPKGLRVQVPPRARMKISHLGKKDPKCAESSPS